MFYDRDTSDCLECGSVAAAPLLAPFGTLLLLVVLAFFCVRWRWLWRNRLVLRLRHLLGSVEAHVPAGTESSSLSVGPASPRQTRRAHQ